MIFIGIEMILNLQTWEITYREYTQRQRTGSDRERKILYDLTYMWTIKIAEFIETE